MIKISHALTDQYKLKHTHLFKNIFQHGHGHVPEHETSSLEEPGHEAPPFIGAGLLHCLVLFFLPVLTLHELQDPQEFQTP